MVPVTEIWNHCWDLKQQYLVHYNVCNFKSATVYCLILFEKKIFILWLCKVTYLAFRKKTCFLYIMHIGTDINNIKDQAISDDMYWAINCQCGRLKVKSSCEKSTL